MPWKEQTMEMNREEFVKRVLSHEKSKSALCREYGISRPTGDKWITRYQKGEKLSDMSRAPFRIANKTPSETESLILEYRKKHPAIGAVKIKRILKNKGYAEIPCASTINAILKRNGCITKEASEAATPYQRFEKSKPNEMWQSDFKGHFAMKNGERCHPLNIIDDHSRFSLCSDALSTEEYGGVRESFERLFRTYGIPDSLLCDNGNPWGTAQSTGFTRFEIWLMELGVLTLHGRIRHPQTQGKDESFNRSLTKELLKFTEIADFKDAQKKFDAYREFYNNERPHFALNLDTPAQHYASSSRVYPEKIHDWEYPSGYELRKIKDSGYLTYGGQGYFLSEAFGNHIIAVRESHISGCVSLFYRQFRIGRINVDKRVFTMKKAYLIEGDPRLGLTQN
jgi:transposase InsO family protein